MKQPTATSVRTNGSSPHHTPLHTIGTPCIIWRFVLNADAGPLCPTYRQLGQWRRDHSVHVGRLQSITIAVFADAVVCHSDNGDHTYTRTKALYCGPVQGW